MRYGTLAIAVFLVALGGVGCVSEAEHDRVARELKRSEIESAQRAGEIVALRQMVIYYTSYASGQPQSQAALMELARAYSELVRRYAALSSDVDALKHRSEGSAASVAPATTTAQRKPLPPGIDPFMDR